MHHLWVALDWISRILKCINYTHENPFYNVFILFIPKHHLEAQELQKIQ